MRVAFYTLEASTLSWARRLLDEGCEVLVYCKSKAHSDVGMGIVPLCLSRDKWLAWGAQSPDTIYFFDCTDDGELADRIRATGKHVIGGGKFMDRLENDRDWGEKFAQKAGILCPPTMKFSSISESIKFLESDPKQKFGDGGWAWKPDRNIGTDATLVTKDNQQMIEHVSHIRERFGDKIPCIVQEKIDGVALSTARWFNGRAFVGPYEGTLEEKKLMAGDIGPATGCSLNTVWFYREDEPQIAAALQFKRIEEQFRANSAPPGLYDINCIVNKKGAWFLEWTPRLGIDSELTSQRGVKSLSALFERLILGGNVDELFDTDTAFHAVRLSVPPYPVDIKGFEQKSPAVDVPVRGTDGFWKDFFVGVGCKWDEKHGLRVADPYGFVGSCVVADRSVKKGFERIYEFLKKLQIPNLQYRTDAAKIVQDDIDEMENLGWGTTPALKK